MASIRPTRIPPPSRAGARPHPVQRLASLKHPTPSPIRPPQPKPAATPKPSTCPNPGCPAPNVVEDDGQKVCSGCGTVISESNIVSEITFGESSSGAAIVQGTYIGADQTHVRSSGPGFHRGGGIESREITEQNGNRYIQQLSRALHVPESATKAAGQVFKLAVGLNFIQGRRTKTVAAVSLYIACRRQDGSTIMLIDFSDVLMINVFKLGRTYKALLDELRLGGNHFIMNPIDPESLIYRFSKQLEFGPAMMHVASEAVRIVQRMNRDWMTTGRRPAGICGAALILAARMNNFRRTIREVVYVVKVTELTIHQRLQEFKATESGELTVDQFRTVQLENSHDPPAFTRAREGKPGRTKKRKALETAEEIEDDESDGSVLGETPPPKRPRRVDADGFAIPDIPIDPALLASGPQKNASSDGADDGQPERDKQHSSTKPSAPVLSEEELAAEAALENEMTALLANGSSLVASAEPPAPTSSANEDTVKPVPKPVSSSEEIDPSEFDSDPEVKYCQLSPAEVEIKERIWVHENKDYLRTQQAKALKRALTAADPSAATNKPRVRRKGRIGDISYLNGEGGEDADGKGSSRASTPAEATRLMLERRGFSKKINYSMLEKMYDDDSSKEVKPPPSENSLRSRSRSVSVSRSIRSSSVVSDRGYSDRGYGSTRASARTKLLKGKLAAQTEAARNTAATPPPTHTRHHRVPPGPAISRPTPPPTAPPREPVPEPEPEPAQPVNPNEEILGYIPGPEPAAREKPVEDYGEEGEEDEDEDDEEEYEDEEDRVEDAFAGHYYEEGSDGGYDDDF